MYLTRLRIDLSLGDFPPNFSLFWSLNFLHHPDPSFPFFSSYCGILAHQNDDFMAIYDLMNSLLHLLLTLLLLGQNNRLFICTEDLPSFTFQSLVI